MTIIRCPRCRDEVAVPLGATSRALVRCPLCQEQYLLAEAMCHAPPALIIIGGEVAQEVLAAQQASESLPTDAEYRLSGGPVATPEYHPGRVAAASAMAARPALRASGRQRPRPGSPLVLAVNYVGGGALGLALGLLVLWWGFKRDPLELGPAFAAYVPWLVPPAFRGQPAVAPAADASPPASAMTANRRAKKTTEEPHEQPLQSLPAFETTQPPAASSLTPAIETPLLTDPTADRPLPENVRESGEAKEIDPASATADAPSAPRGAMPDLTSLLPDDWQSRVPVENKNREFFAAVDLTDAINQASGTLARYGESSTAPAESRQETFVQLHADLGEIGRLLSYRELGQTGLSEPMAQVEKMLARLAKDPFAIAQLTTMTAQRWPDTSDGRGLFVVGTVQATAAAGALFIISLKGGGELLMPVAALTNPDDLCESGDQVLVVGRVVEEPKINLPGYDGQHPKLIMAGFVYRVPN